MNIARKIQWCGQNYLRSSSFWLSSTCLIESTLRLTDRELVSIRKMGQLCIIQSTWYHCTAVQWHLLFVFAAATCCCSCPTLLYSVRLQPPQYTHISSRLYFFLTLTWFLLRQLSRATQAKVIFLVGESSSRKTELEDLDRAWCGVWLSYTWLPLPGTVIPWEPDGESQRKSPAASSTCWPKPNQPKPNQYLNKAIAKQKDLQPGN